MAISLCRIIFFKKLWPDFNYSDLKKLLINIKKVKEILELYEKKNLKKRIYTSILFVFLFF